MRGAAVPTRIDLSEVNISERFVGLFSRTLRAPLKLYSPHFSFTEERGSASNSAGAVGGYLRVYGSGAMRCPPPGATQPLHSPRSSALQMNPEPDSSGSSAGEGVSKPPVEGFSAENEISPKLSFPGESLSFSNILAGETSRKRVCW